MKKTVFLISIAVLSTLTAAGAQERGKEPLFGLGTELFAGIDGSREVGTLTLAELTAFPERLSLLLQQAEFVRASRRASFLLPGMGQFRNGASLPGALYLTGHSVIIIGSLLGSYVLLPSAVKFGNTNYVSDTFGYIEESWKRQSLRDILPSLAVLLGGTILDTALRLASASNAEKLAVENIRSGKVSFTPDPLLLIELLSARPELPVPPPRGNYPD